MPLDEEGAKWSCEPCVRGHRSSKCQHFDRMMMKVPKAGRPLAKCPHPKGTCSCQKLYAFMVRIPKGSTCLCRPLYKVPMVVSENGQDPQPASQSNPEPTPAVSGTSPAAPLASPNAKSHRVQKRTKRQNSSRGLSEIAAKDLEAHPDIAVDQNLGEVSSTPDLPAPDPKYGSQFPTPAVPASAYPENTQYDSRPNAPEPLSSAPASHAMPPISEKKGCCSARRAPENISQPLVSGPSNINGGRGENFVTTGTEVKEEAGAVHNDVRTVSSDLPQRSFSAAGIQTETETSDIGPPHRGMTPTGGRFSTSMSAPVTGYSSPVAYPQYGAVGRTPGSQNYPLSVGPSYQTNNFGNSGETSHNCGCGDGCQCLGCASHPFNDTTRQHIQEMGYMMTFRGDNRSSESPKENNATPSYNDQQYPHDMGYSQFPMHTAHQPAQGYTNTFEHIAQPNSNPLASMPTSTQSQGGMMMQPGAYLTVEYPIGFLDPCSNLSGTCQCGISCPCVGCLTHDGHNGISLEPSPPPENSVEFPMPAMGLPTPHNDPSLQMPMYGESRNEYQPNPPP